MDFQHKRLSSMFPWDYFAEYCNANLTFSKLSNYYIYVVCTACVCHGVSWCCRRIFIKPYVLILHWIPNSKQLIPCGRVQFRGRAPAPPPLYLPPSLYKISVCMDVYCSYTRQHVTTYYKYSLVYVASNILLCVCVVNNYFIVVNTKYYHWFVITIVESCYLINTFIFSVESTEWSLRCRISGWHNKDKI